jgi:glycosyltransferase involved in cell wall biosynthesis
MEKPKVSVVMPVYNECWTIREIVRRVLAMSDWVDELVIVDDGSTDGTRELLERIGRDAKKKKGSVDVRVLLRERNAGKGAALSDGFRAAEGDVVLVQDADLEYDPRDYPALLAPIFDGRADVVYGSRFLGESRNALLFWHTVANRLLTTLCNLATNLNLSDVWTGYKAFRSEIVRRMPVESRGFDFEPEVTVKLAKVGCRFYEVPITYQGRTYAEGKKIGLKDAWVALWRIAQSSLAGDLGELAVGERTLRIMSRAGRYSRFLFEQARPHLGPRVVEIGAGVGNISRYLLDRERVVLTDSDPGYLRRLQAAFRDWEYVEVVPLDVERPAAADRKLDGTFDAALCFNVIEHVRDDRAAAARLARLLKPGGRAVVLVPAHAWLYGSLDRHLGHHRRYGRKDLEALLEGAGLEIEELRFLNPLAVPGWFFNGRVIPRKVIPDVQLGIFDRFTPLVRFLARFDLPVGLSLFAVGRKERG